MQVPNNKCDLGAVCVLGFGRTGFGVVEYLTALMGSRVSSITIYGGGSSVPSDATRALESKGVRVVYGTDDVDDHFDLAIASPGIPPTSHFFVSAKSHARTLIGEPEFAWRESPKNWVGITGTNGKTTTTLLCEELLQRGGLQAKALGNIGIVATGEVLGRMPGTWFVAELSSFQLETSRDFHPRVGCLLNITPDHIEWHGSFDAYVAAKERLFANFDKGDLAIVSCDDPYCRAIVRRLKARGLRVCEVSVHGEPQDYCAAYVCHNRLVVRLDSKAHELLACEDLILKGEHNMQNALCAAALALELGVSDEAVCDVLRTFRPLEHRIEPCGEVAGIRFVNDSKATNVDSVVKALTAFEQGRIVLLLGGHDKGTDLASLVDAVHRRCRAAICYGEAGPRIADALRSGNENGTTSILLAEHLRDALGVATSVAEEGDVVLLSPACSSFDEFSSFQERGTVFKKMVAALMEGGSL